MLLLLFLHFMVNCSLYLVLHFIESMTEVTELTSKKSTSIISGNPSDSNDNESAYDSNGISLYIFS